ncbi:hypothetical protein HK105_202975 [Polyrhizophydium stewartii]|uniref:Protein kinase domain-containing protein n=1 Tax=Polyrhizophydium stewartii TaxID=2732419 RepID=A0ABR4NCZ3_9FUNG
MVLFDATNQSVETARWRHLLESRGLVVESNDIHIVTSTPFSKERRRQDHFDSGSRDPVKALERKASTWFPLRHSNVLPLLRMCLDVDRPFLVMPLMSNNARNHVSIHTNMSINERIGILLDTARGMQYLHHTQQRVIHGDLKASNILIGDDGRAQICDFGLSFVKADSDVDAPLRTDAVRWAAPEVHNKECKVDFPSGVFSFAMTAIELFTGEPPFAEDDGTDDNGEPDDVWQLIADCCQKGPSTRPSVDEIVERLEAIRKQPNDAFQADGAATSLEA